MNDKIRYEDLCKFITDTLNRIFLEKQFPNLRFTGMSTCPSHYKEWRFTTSPSEDPMQSLVRLKLKARMKPEGCSSDADIIEFLNSKPLSLYLGDVSGDIRCIDFELDKCHTHMYIDYPLIKTKHGAQFSKLIEVLYRYVWKWCCNKRSASNNEKLDEELNKTNAVDSSDPVNDKNLEPIWDRKDDDGLRDEFRYCVQNSYPEKLVMIHVRNIRIRNMITTIFASYANKYLNEYDFNYTWESSEDGFGYKIIDSSNNDKLLWCDIINNVALITHLDISSIKSIDSYYIPLVVIDFNQKLIDVTAQSALKFISKDGICHSPIYREIIYKILVNIRMINERNSIKEKNVMNGKKIENASIDEFNTSDELYTSDKPDTSDEPDTSDKSDTSDKPDTDAVSKNGTNLPEIKEVIYADAATTVIWSDGSKTTSKVKTKKVPNGTNKDGTVKFKKVLDETFDPEVGLAMCIAKKYYNNTRNQFCKNVKKFKKLSDERCAKKAAAVKKKSEKNTSSATAKKTTSRTSTKTTSTTKKTTATKTTRKKSNK